MQPTRTWEFDAAITKIRTSSCPPPTMSRVLAALDDAGLLVRTPDPQDARSALVELSPEGRAMIEQLRTDGADLNKAVGLIGTPEEVRQSFAYAKRGDVPTRHAVSVTPLSNSDPSQAPPGQSLAYIYLPATPVVGKMPNELLSPVRTLTPSPFCRPLAERPGFVGEEP